MKKIIIVFLMMAIPMVIFGQFEDPNPENPSRLWQIISGILLVATMFFGSKVTKLRLLAKEAIDLVTVVLRASEDGNFDAQEQAEIKREALELKSAWRGLLGRIL